MGFQAKIDPHLLSSNRLAGVDRFDELILGPVGEVQALGVDLVAVLVDLLANAVRTKPRAVDGHEIPFTVKGRARLPGSRR